MKILVIDNDESVRTLLFKTLTSYAYTVEVATEGQTGFERALAYTYDLIIANVSLPQLDGISLCRQLRAGGDRTPILLLTAQDTSANTATGLDAGADDYVILPFDLVALMARVRALLRRKDLALVPTEVTWGELCLNPTAAAVTYRGQPLSLTPKEYGLLDLLLHHPQRVFSRSTMLDRIWSSAVSPIEGTITNHIKELRQKLKAVGMTVDMIETVYGLGYRLKAPPQPASLPIAKKAPERPTPASAQFATVMIVDDDRATLEALSYVLHPWGLQVILSQPERFWELLLSAAPDLLILNLEMLTFNGIELCQSVRQDAAWGDLPIVAMTTYTDAESIQKIFAIGVDDFVSKPIVGPELVTRVVSRLERLRYQQQTRLPSGSVSGLALRPQVKSPIGNTASSSSAHQQLLATAHVNLLLVDDQPDNLRVLSAILDGQHYKVRKAISGEIALDAIATLPPDLILLDVKMPEMNGYELCAMLQASEKTRHIPIIFLSALDDTVDKMKAFAVGGVDYITKPFQAEEVLARLKHQLVIQQQQRQLAERNRQMQQAREALRESEAQFRHAFDQLTIGVGLIGLDDRWLKVNPALCQLLGYAESELLSTPTAASIDAADVEQWQQSFQQLLQNQTTHYQLDLRYRSKGDRTLWVSINISLVRDGSGQALYVLAQMQAIGDGIGSDLRLLKKSEI
jgi:PAS domain S-box-containing protein